MFKTAAILLLFLLAIVSAAAQEAPAPQKPPPPVEQATPVRPPEPPGQPVNVRIELTITDEVAPGGPAKRTVTMIVADRTNGRIRSIGNQVPARLLVDAAPHILADGSIRVQLGLEYNPQQAPAEDADAAPVFPGSPKPVGGSSLHENIAVVLRPGKPLIISQASDPLSDRKITVEVRAEILK